jgi:hypothetical protein
LSTVEPTSVTEAPALRVQMLDERIRFLHCHAVALSIHAGELHRRSTGPTGPAMEQAIEEIELRARRLREWAADLAARGVKGDAERTGDQT